ncbi:MAG: hypothetical protein IKZ87_02905 [Actinomycetaceae bacterium]|nr:hypothetical protein [Actinomycetaceae bacterium]
MSKTEERYSVTLDVSRDDNGFNVISAWKGDELRFSEKANTLHANFGQYMERLGMELMEFMPDVIMYAELEIMMHDCYADFCYPKADGEREKYTEYYDDFSPIMFYADRQLTDEEKFVCALLSAYNSEIGLTSDILCHLFGWSKYKSYKVARACVHKNICTLIREDGQGYYGKGWMLQTPMHTAVARYTHQVYESRKTSV